MPFNYPAGRNPKKRGNIDLQRCGIAQEGGREERKKRGGGSKRKHPSPQEGGNSS